jgi:EAL domain-containing protein (putative c-di-GMP-specific phosphodiesterase class I)
LTDNPNNKTFHLVQAIHALGTSLGLTVIAEGVETHEQRECLLRIGIQFGQGNLYAEAAGIEDIGNPINFTIV